MLISDDPVTCMGICHGQFHRACTRLTKPAAKMINDIVNVKYWCDDCLEQEGSGASKSDEMLEMKAILENIKLSIVAIEEKIRKSVCEVVSIGITNMQKTSIDAIETKFASSVSDAVNTDISSIEKKLNTKVACNMPKKKTW